MALAKARVGARFHLDYIFDAGIDGFFRSAARSLASFSRMTLYPFLVVRVLLRTSVSGVELQPVVSQSQMQLPRRGNG